MIWNWIISLWRHCKWFHIIFLYWNAFLWGYTSSWSYRQNVNISLHFGIYHYFFWCWWFLLTNPIWCIGYLLLLERLYGYEFFHKWVPKLSPLLLFPYHLMILNPYMLLHHHLLFLSLLSVTDSFIIKKV